MKNKLSPLDYIRIIIRDFFRHRIIVEIGFMTATQEPILSVWFWGYLVMRKRFSLVMQQWIDVEKNEAFEL